jgi:hypothetical protein
MRGITKVQNIKPVLELDLELDHTLHREPYGFSPSYLFRFVLGGQTW